MSYGTVMFMQYYAEAKSIASAKLLISQTLEDSMRSKGELEEWPSTLHCQCQKSLERDCMRSIHPKAAACTGKRGTCPFIYAQASCVSPRGVKNPESTSSIISMLRLVENGYGCVNGARCARGIHIRWCIHHKFPMLYRFEENTTVERVWCAFGLPQFCRTSGAHYWGMCCELALEVTNPWISKSVENLHESVSMSF